MVAAEVSLLVQVKVLPGITVPSDSLAAAVNCCVSPSSIEGDDGETSIRSTTGGGAVTVSVAVPDLPSTDAVIVVEPASLAVAKPELLMVATVVLLLIHAKVLPVISMSSESYAVAENCCVSPSSIEGDDGDTVTRSTTGGGSVTLKVAVPDLPSTSAVIVVDPASLAEAKPELLMVATVVLLLVQVKVLPDISSPPDVRAFAVNCCVSPSSIEGDDGDTVTRSTTGGGGGGSVTLRFAVPDLPSTDALIVVEPALTPVAVVAVPDDGLIVATEVLLLDHVKVLPVMRSLSES